MEAHGVRGSLPHPTHIFYIRKNTYIVINNDTDNEALNLFYESWQTWKTWGDRSSALHPEPLISTDVEIFLRMYNQGLGTSTTYSFQTDFN